MPLKICSYSGLVSFPGELGKPKLRKGNNFILIKSQNIGSLTTSASVRMSCLQCCVCLNQLATQIIPQVWVHFWKTSRSLMCKVNMMWRPANMDSLLYYRLYIIDSLLHHRCFQGSKTTLDVVLWYHKSNSCFKWATVCFWMAAITLICFKIMPTIHYGYW